MADTRSDGVSWFSVLSLVPPEYHYILHRISMFFAGLACVIITPIIGLIIYDLSLWFWRLVAGLGALQSSQQQTETPSVPLKDRGHEAEKIASDISGDRRRPRRSAEKAGVN